MSPFINVIIYLAVGTAGGLLGSRFRFPASTILGACLAVVAFNLFWRHQAPMPKAYTTAIQIMVGVMVGAAFTPDLFKHLNKVALVVFGTTFGLIAAGVGLAVLFIWLGFMDPSTALLATSPGGISGLLPVAAEIGANPPLVFVCHVVRLLTVLITTPILLTLVANWLGKGG
jgi:membrane AbrB-like protein